MRSCLILTSHLLIFSYLVVEVFALSDVLHYGRKVDYNVDKKIKQIPYQTVFNNVKNAKFISVNVFNRSSE